MRTCWTRRWWPWFEVNEGPSRYSPVLVVRGDGASPWETMGVGMVVVLLELFKGQVLQVKLVHHPGQGLGHAVHNFLRSRRKKARRKKRQDKEE